MVSWSGKLGLLPLPEGERGGVRGSGSLDQRPVTPSPPPSPQMGRGSPTESAAPSCINLGRMRASIRHNSREETTMSMRPLATGALALIALALSGAAQAQRPQIATTKVDGTDNVYIFRNGNHQAMFVVTKDGVIATDP